MDDSQLDVMRPEVFEGHLGDIVEEAEQQFESDNVEAEAQEGADKVEDVEDPAHETKRQELLNEEQRVTEWAEGKAQHKSDEDDDDDDAAQPRKKSRPMSIVDEVYTDMAAVPLDKERMSALLGADCMTWLQRLEGALQVPWETVMFLLLSMTSFQLYRTVAQYTEMLGIPPLPWLGVLGRPGESKSVGLWFLKQVVLELQRRTTAAAGFDASIDTDDSEEEEMKRKKPKKQQPRFLADLGTLYGFMQQASVNEERAFVALHEARTFFGKVLSEAPGYDPQALNKLYDRDEVDTGPTLIQNETKTLQSLPHPGNRHRPLISQGRCVSSGKETDPSCYLEVRITGVSLLRCPTQS